MCSARLFQGSSPGSGEQDVAAQFGDGVRADSAAARANDGKAAQGWIGDEHGGRDGAGGNLVLFPAGEIKVKDKKEMFKLIDYIVL